MDRTTIETHLAVDRYIRGTMAGDELAEFEERLVWDRQLLDEVDLAARLRDGLRTSKATGEIDVAGSRIGNRFAAIFQVPAYAAAASFLLAVGMTSLVMTTWTPGEYAVAPDAPSRTEIVPLFTTRTSSGIEVTVSESTWTVLLVDAPPDYEIFRATIFRLDDDTVVWSRDDLASTYPDSLALGMPGGLLGEAEYRLRIDGKTASADDWQAVQSVPFSVAQLR